MLTLAGIILGVVFTNPRFIGGFLTGEGFMLSGIVCFALFSKESLGFQG